MLLELRNNWNHNPGREMRLGDGILKFLIGLKLAKTNGPTVWAQHLRPGPKNCLGMSYAESDAKANKILMSVLVREHKLLQMGGLSLSWLE